MTEEVELQRRCDRNRKRSKRRSIYCPVHQCYLHSVSQKYPIYADRAEQLQERGLGRRYALLAVATQTTVTLSGEWLEAFWCDECQSTEWYHVCRLESNAYEISPAPAELWQQAIGVTSANGNPSVSEFTLRHSRASRISEIKDFKFAL